MHKEVKNGFNFAPRTPGTPFRVVLDTGASSQAYLSYRSDLQHHHCRHQSVEAVQRTAMREIPFEHGILLNKFIEVGHEFIYRFSHVHMPDVRPYGVNVRQGGGLIFVSPDGRLKFVSATYVRW
jgi:hypothetical protein